MCVCFPAVFQLVSRVARERVSYASKVVTVPRGHGEGHRYQPAHLSDSRFAKWVWNTEAREDITAATGPAPNEAFND